MTRILFKDIAYLAGDGLSPSRGDILVEDGKIAALGENLSLDGSVTETVQGKHLLALPGFVNTHTHIAMTILRGYGGDQDLATWLNEYIWPAEARLSDEDVYWGSALALLEMTAAGVTTIADMYDHMEAVATIVAESGLRANLCRGMIGFADADRHSLRENDDLFDRWNDKENGRIRVWYGPHATNTCEPEYLKEVAARAHEKGSGIHIHVSETKTEFDDIQKRFGMTPVALAAECGLFDGPAIIAHGVWLTDDDIALLKKYNVAVAHNPASNMKLASGLAPVVALRKAGVPVGIGTDGASSNNRLSVLHDAQLAALMHKLEDLDPTAVSAKEALTMATIEGARALQWDDEIGSLAVGKAADLVCIDMDKPWLVPNFDPIATLVYAARSDDVSRVYASGELLYKNGEWTRLDAERICFEANKVAHRIVQH